MARKELNFTSPINRSGKLISPTGGWSVSVRKRECGRDYASKFRKNVPTPGALPMYTPALRRTGKLAFLFGNFSQNELGLMALISYAYIHTQRYGF